MIFSFAMCVNVCCVLMCECALCVNVCYVLMCVCVNVCVCVCVNVLWRVNM